ncbi:MAG: outer membrane lipoprotein-sorting protein [Myxococcales bacterium]|nr:outer membrane lipoprotein-sorting protein [Myxococcales bacterium]MCB9647888.1 outer membrane lipoprotein-sorting protein [Deltaproteobacteria bacterium]
MSAAPAQALTQAEVDAVVERLDVRQRNSGDYKALAYIEQKERGKNDLFYQSVFYRRDADDKLMILFLKPKSEAGKGYLRLDKNLFMYDPTVGKWERRTERERIMGTDSRRQDFDESRLAEEYTAKFIGDEKLGKVAVHHIELKAREGQDVAYPTLQLWVDQETGNLLKRQDLALSGRLMRTTYYPKWKKVFSESKNADVYYPEEIHIFDEVEKGNRTTVAITEVDLRPLSENIFTKAWLESKSR